MEKIKLVVCGSNSMVGSRFCELSRADFDLILADFTGDISVDITKEKSVNSLFTSYDFEWIILFSAFTEVDAAEKQRNDKTDSCWKINVEGTQNIVSACHKYHRKLIFISTDFVFDGTSGPYSEKSKYGPNLDKVSWYGITKIEAEKLITATYQDFLILRISYPYRGRFKSKDDIIKRILRLYRDGQLYPMFKDQIFTQTFIDDLAPAIKILLSKNQRGIFHLASPTTANQYDFAREIISVFGGNPDGTKKASIIEYLKKPGVTPRPVRGGLKVAKIKKTNFMPTDWKTGIYKVFSQYGGKLL